MAIEIRYSDGRTDEADTVDAAKDIIEREYPDAAYCENGWEPLGNGDRERLLAWRNEEDADGIDGLGDGGQQAIAEIVRED